MKVIAKDLVGVNAISMQSGKHLYDVIYEPLKSGDKVEIDFVGVGLFASPFFNAGIGYLLKDINIEDLQRDLKFTNLSDVGRQILNLVISNAIKYYDEKNNLPEMLESINKDPEDNK
ncbi:MAG: STAS-like domain-containing protein [Methylococcales bacterium]